MSLEKKISNLTFFVGVTIALTGASLISNAFEYFYNKAEQALSNSNANYSQTLNNTNNSLIYTNR